MRGECRANGACIHALVLKRLFNGGFSGGEWMGLGRGGLNSVLL